MMQLKREFEALAVDVSLVSVDSPETNRKFRRELEIPFRLLSDEDHAAADRYRIPIARKHPKAWFYKDGFIQPAVFVFHGEREIFRFVQKPRMLNLWGAARRPEPSEILAAIRQQIEGHPGK